MNFKYGTFRRVKRDPQSGPEPSTIVSVTYVTAAPTFTGPIVGYMTLGPAMDINSGDKVATPSNSGSSTGLSTSSQIILSTSANVETQVAATSTTTATSTFTSTSFSTSYSTSSISETSTSIVSSSSSSVTSTSVSLSSTTAETPSSTTVPEQVVEATLTSAKAATTTIPIAMAMTTPTPSATSSIVTSLKDLPLVIESPTSTVPKSMSLLVATSSSTPLTPHSSVSVNEPMPTSPIAPTVSSPSDTDGPPESSSMGATGKASLIIGVVLLLGAIFMLLQVYLNKRRRSLAGEKIGDDEKGGLPVMKSRSAAATPIPPQKDSTTVNKSVNNSVASANLQNEKTGNLRPNSPLINPFGKNAEILVDPINAKGANVLEKVNPVVGGQSSPIRQDRVASIQGPKPLDLGVAKQSASPPSPATTEFSTAPTNPISPNAAVGMAPSNGMVNAVYRVLLDFIPSMDDELELRAGQLIRVLHEYDDGWAMCIRLDNSKQGVCPRTCLSPRPVKPRSPSSGPRGPPPAINLPKTPCGRPQSQPRTPRGSPQYILPGTPGRKPSFGQDPAMIQQGHQSPRAFGPHDLPGQEKHQPRNMGHSDINNPEIPLPLALFPRGLPGAIQSQEGAPMRVGTVPCGTPSTNPGAHSIMHSAGLNTTVTPSSASISMSPECPGPMAPSSDYFSLNKPTPELPMSNETTSTKPPCSNKDFGASSDAEVLQSPTGEDRRQPAFLPLDLENERSVPGQAL